MEINLEDLYWEDWSELSKRTEQINEIFNYIKDFKKRDINELANILKLYNNPSGAFVDEFANIIAALYKFNKIKFIKALNIVKDESINLVYIFRNKNIFIDEEKELDEILMSGELTYEERDTANTFFQMYKNICSS